MKKELQERARGLRKNQTEAEKTLWHHLRSRQIENCKFRRQHPIGNYIIDFVCLEKKLIIEIDGGHHSEQIKYDAKRTHYLESLGYNVIRFWNHDVLQKKNSVLEHIYNQLAAPSPLPSPSREREKKTDRIANTKESNKTPHTVPSPLWGEG